MFHALALPPVRPLPHVGGVQARLPAADRRDVEEVTVAPRDRLVDEEVLRGSNPEIAVEERHSTPAPPRALVEGRIPQRHVEVPGALSIAQRQPRPAADLELLKREILDSEPARRRGPQELEGLALRKEDDEVHVLRVARFAPDGRRDAAVDQIVHGDPFRCLDRRQQDALGITHDGACGVRGTRDGDRSATA